MATPSAGAPRRNAAGLARDVDLLDALAGPEALREGGLGVLRAAALVGRDKAAVSRALATLAEAGLLARDPVRRTYRLGPRLYALAARTAEATLVHEARPLLRQVVASVRETAHLCVLRGGDVLTLLSETGPREVGTSTWGGLSTPALRTPSGRVLLSDWPPSAVRAWFDEHGARPRPLPWHGGVEDRGAPGASARFPVLPDAPSDAAVHDLDTLLAELGRIRGRGWATSVEELESGVVAASAPVRDATGTVVAALNVSAPAARLRPRVEELAEHVARCARALSVGLGHQTAHAGGPGGL